MIKKIFIFLAAFFLCACSTKNTMQKVSDLSNQQPCFSCESDQAFEARIRGLLYLSDIGLKCCADKRTIDSGVALKKVYLHRIYDLEEEKKIFYANDKKYFINEQFNVAFYIFLKQELKARGIVVIEEINNSPYVLRLDLHFLDFSSRLDPVGLHSNVSAKLSLKDININKEFIVRTKQDVMGFRDLKEISFYTFLLIKQMANKTASVISSL
ncbi:outer membrane lipoprotein MapA [Campylobacter troglodytis]|uniref:outer membrane lipoprotein MapA n=1 Tax=Campylobacter troglodytis TaxID=654363 RepID=UPI0011575401|nr:outer membrane lipoprotein MapA [Campylobacter troglodytis]TQR57703.1 hypothetical protein DMC01_08445 [Campylobacter troglodytis]